MKDGQAYHVCIIIKKGTENGEVMSQLRKEFKDLNVQINCFFYDADFKRVPLSWETVFKDTLLYAQGQKCVSK
jgi:hypothetical protein